MGVSPIGSLPFKYFANFYWTTTVGERGAFFENWKLLQLFSLTLLGVIVFWLCLRTVFVTMFFEQIDHHHHHHHHHFRTTTQFPHHFCSESYATLQAWSDDDEPPFRDRKAAKKGEAQGEEKAETKTEDKDRTPLRVTWHPRGVFCLCVVSSNGTKLQRHPPQKKTTCFFFFWGGGGYPKIKMQGK